MPVTLHAADGWPLAATWFEPPGPARGTVLVAAALGVPQRFYAPFCRWLAARGLAVMSFDLRGIGASRPASMRSVAVDMLGWARLDFAAAVAHAAGRAGAPVTVLGHSLGAHHAGMSTEAAQAAIAKLVAVAAGTGYWRDWAPASRRRAPLLLHVAAPLVTPLVGWFPGARLGMVGDLPRGVIAQWSRWCRHPRFAPGVEGAPLVARLAALRCPIHSIGFTDDESMTEACLRQWLAAHPSAPSRLTMLSPAALGVPRIGHLGAFRAPMEPSVWPHLAEAVEAG